MKDYFKDFIDKDVQKYFEYDPDNPDMRYMVLEPLYLQLIKEIRRLNKNLEQDIPICPECGNKVIMTIHPYCKKSRQMRSKKKKGGDK